MATTEVKITSWQNCYDSGWSGSGLITEPSFAHPAKMALALLQRIIRHGLDKAYWQPGDIVGDPFGGIGSTGIVGAYHGLKCVLVELEPRFVELAQANFALHRPRWAVSGDPEPVIVQGDSRRFAEIVGEVCGVVSSPPYAESMVGREENAEMRGRHLKVGKDAGPNSQAFAKPYGTTPGQIGSLPAGQLDAAITSPPYAETAVAKNSTGIDRRKQWETYRSQGGGMSFEAFDAQQARHSGDYGTSEGQIGALRFGQLDAVVSSPPYAESLSHTKSKEDIDGKLAEAKANGQTADRATWGANKGSAGFSADDYGQAPGQIGSLPGGNLDAVISSPPYAESIKGDHGERETAAESTAKRQTQGGSLGQSMRHGGYGATEGNIGNLREGAVDAVVTSPPWENQEPSHAQGSKFEEVHRELHPTKLAKDRPSIFQHEYGKSDGQIGNLKGGSLNQCAGCGKLLPHTQQNNSPGPGGLAAQSAPLSVQPSGPAAQGDSDEDELGLDRRILRGRRQRDVVRGEESGRGPRSRGDNRAEGESPVGTDSAVPKPSGFQGSENLLAEAVQEQVRTDGARLLDSATNPQSREQLVSDQDSAVPHIEAGEGFACPGEAEGAAGAVRLDEQVRQGTDPGLLCQECQRGGNSHGAGDRSANGEPSDSRSRETYWEAMRQVYSQCHTAIRPNGVLCVVVKDYVSKGKRVPLCDQTCTLLDALGFVVFERTRCWLVKRDEHPGLFGEAVVKTTERKSFFRRLAEKKGSPRIDFEEVIWCVKPAPNQRTLFSEAPA